ncbi:hypothetical protein [Chitinimonas lacunae]|uniref:Uncharacterized protein n=1 Tax=Chitinimonas lacunae TaxID=1963018 RepID=A0ABV8MUI7_9NEIS
MTSGISALRPLRTALFIAAALTASAVLPAQAASVQPAGGCGTATLPCSTTYRFEGAALLAGRIGPLPELEISESAPGAFDLTGNRTLAILPLAPLTLDKTSPLQVQVRNARGEVVNGAVRAQFLTSSLDSRGELRLYLDAGWNSPGDGPYRITLSGLRATVVDSSYEGELALRIGGARRSDSLPLEDGEIGSDFGAKATLAWLPVTVSATQGTGLPAPVQIADPTQAVIAGLEVKVGRYEGKPVAVYVAAMLGGQILLLTDGGWMPFSMLSAAAAAGERPRLAYKSFPATPRLIDIDILSQPTDISGLQGLSLLIGYGLGADPDSFSGSESAFAEMLNSQRFTQIYSR